MAYRLCPLPRPGMLKEMIKPNLKLLLLCDSNNTLTKRVAFECLERKINVKTQETSCPNAMIEAASSFLPDMIICPFMKSRLPEEIYSNQQRPCLVVHPGVPGDRGASSLDWSILEDRKKWGVMVFQAQKEFDAGDIWSTSEFNVREGSTKTSMYVNDVSDNAVKCVLDAISRFCQNVEPVPLDYNNQEVWGTWKRNMNKEDRKIDWTMAAEEIVKRVRMSDTQPGALGKFQINGANLFLRMYDAYEERCKTSSNLERYIRGGGHISKRKPGDVIGRKDGAVLVKAGKDSAVWIGQLKKPKHIKLPSTQVLQRYSRLQNLPEIPFSCAFQEIKVHQSGPVCFIYFDFYNGAMDKYQAARLEATIRQIGTLSDVKVVVLMGGERFFSTGIHLCAIQDSEVKQQEAWENINKIDDVILALSELKNKVTVAVLRGNAGAGGAMISAACDTVLSHPGSLITPTYRAMNLFGSEYWTYFLPRRVGQETALKLVNSEESISAPYAKSIGFVDDLIEPDRSSCQDDVEAYCNNLLYNGVGQKIISEKQTTRDDAWFQQLSLHRSIELREMMKNFQQSAFLNAMEAFVYHTKINEQPRQTGYNI